MSKESLFLRKSSGLVRAWGFLDIFATNSWTNPFVGYYTYFVVLYAPLIAYGNLLLAILISMIVVLPQCLVYAMLVSAMPRVGGEYIWMTRIFKYPVIGFILTLIGWVITPLFWLALCAPAVAGLYFQPICVALGRIDLALWWMTPDGLFVATLWYLAVGVLVTCLGMKWTGRLLSSSFIIGGIIGVIATAIILSIYTPTDFINAYNAFYLEHFGMVNAYENTIKYVTENWQWPIPDFWHWDLAATLPLLGFAAFATSWHMWGAPLYGEVRGASELKMTFWSMAGPNFLNNALMIIYLLAWVKLVGYPFYQASNLLYGTFVWYGFNPAAIDNMMPLYPTPTLYVYLLTKNPFITICICLAGIYFISIAHPVLCALLPSIRVAFAMAFDRMLPAPLASLYTERRIPAVTLALFASFALIFAAVYFYVPGASTLTLMGTMVIILSFMGTCIAGIILPKAKPKLFKSSPASKYYIGKVPLISIAGILAFAYFAYLCYLWIVDPIYGINNVVSAIFFLILYIGATLTYILMKWYRKKQGIDIDLVFKEIPVE
jgi:amino acid transporter